jgi:nicotinamide-nucleotide adenylyltransferase
MMKRDIYISRFRLFHKGYLEVVKYILRQGEQDLIIAIGAAQTSYHRDNPFSGEERAEMITAALTEEGLGERTIVVQIDETNITYESWTSLVESICSPFNTVYSNNELVQLLLQKAGYKTSPVPPFTDREYSYEFVAKRIIEDKPWEDLLPSPVVRIIKERGLIQRIRRLCKKGSYG